MLTQCWMSRLGPCLTVSILSLFQSHAAAWAGEATLTWDPPTARMDGNPLLSTDLAGYKVYGGTASGRYTLLADVGNTTTFTANGVPEGQTFFVSVTAYDLSNNESGFSNEVSLTIPAASFSVSGGCGMVFPRSGKSTGPWPGADLLALLGIILIGLIRKKAYLFARKFATSPLSVNASAAAMLLIVFAAPSAFAAPTITSLSGTVTNGSTITVTGTGFGTKNPAKPLIWADFEQGTITAESSLSTGTLQNDSASLTKVNQLPNSTYAVRGKPNDSVLGKQNVRLFVDTSPTPHDRWYFFVKRLYGNPTWWSYSMTSAANYKYMRNWPQCANGYADFFAVIYVGSPPIGYHWQVDNFVVPLTKMQSGTPPVNEWFIEEHQGYQGTLNNSDASYTEWINGAMVGGKTSTFSWLTSTYPSNLQCFGIENYWTLNPPPPDAYVYFDDFYADIVWSRVMIGDQSTFAASTRREIQIPTAWSDASITITFNPGSFASPNNAYLYVIDSNGNVNANGYPICPTCPQPPKNLQVK